MCGSTADGLSSCIAVIGDGMLSDECLQSRKPTDPLDTNEAICLGQKSQRPSDARGVHEDRRKSLDAMRKIPSRSRGHL